MTNQLLTSALVVGSLVASAQPDKPVDSKITDVTVFLSSAQITRVTKAKVEAGKTNLIITGLSSQLDPQSVQVAGKGGVVILGISHRQNYLSEFNLPRPIRMLKDSVETLQRQLVLEQSQKEILDKEEHMLLSNQKIGGANQNLTVAELKAMADFYRTRLGDIVSARMKQEEKVKKLNERIIRLTAQITSEDAHYRNNTSELIVHVAAEAATNVELQLRYVVAQAGWIPVYDLRAADTKSPVQLNYKANVFQNTGEEWNNVRLKLSTANPNLSGLKPELQAWYLNFYYPAQYALRGRAAGVQLEAAAPMAASKMKEDKVQYLDDFVTTIQTALTTEFDITLPYTVPSTSKPVAVDIRKYDMKADYIYSVAPKLDVDAFLMARATGWEEFNLLPGEANIFFEETFVGKSFIDPNNIKDTLAVSLGRDKRIVVKREKVKDLTSKNFTGSSRKETYTWEIAVRNTKTDAIKIIVEDQVPVAQHTQIEVTAVDLGDAKFNKDTGKLTWELELKPNETRKLVYKFEVKYPKDRQIAGL
ncbi:MAG: DUF4139 domain-containing protein [Cyclobacteriaceae bacterium]|nr:DUF4139 domain-containing protein [Cyclobacteriaceae bacterium]